METTANKPATKVPSAPEWLRIRHMDTYMRTPALRTAIKAWLEIEESGHGDGGQLISWNHPVLVALDTRDKTVCGILTYSRKDEESVIHVRIGYVEVSHRGHGIYSHLWHALMARAKKDGAMRIVGTTHAQNTGMKRLAVRLGRKQTPLVQYEQILDDPASPTALFGEDLPA